MLQNPFVVDVNRLCVLFWLEWGFKSFCLLKTKTSICLLGLSFVFYVFVVNLCVEITSFVFQRASFFKSCNSFGKQSFVWFISLLESIGSLQKRREREVNIVVPLLGVDLPSPHF